jgi:ATP-dependent Clp protease ATP-binding subunit ClpC
MERHSVAKLIGAPPGYVGYEEGGNLTEMVRHRPYSVILFDEIEKAHPEVFNVLLQVLDNGRLTDAKGRLVNFKNTIIIMTSNVGAQHIQKMEKIGFGGIETDMQKYQNVKEKLGATLKEYFRPEFLNRIDDIIVFDILNEQAIEEIVKIQVDIIKERLLVKDIKLDITPDVYKYLAKEGYNPEYGARPLKRLIQNKILNPVANLIISRGVTKGGEIMVGLSGTEFTFEVKKGKRGTIVTSINKESFTK